MSQVGFGPPVRIDGPLPQRRPGCLLDVAAIIPEPTEYWLNGARVFPFPADTGHVHDACSAAGSPRTKATPTTPASPHFGAFTAYVPIKCTAATVGVDPEWFSSRAVAVMEALESTIAERVFATGEGMDASQPHLTDPDLVTLSGSAVSLTEGLALLEDAIAATGRGGVIHASPSLVAALGMGGAFAAGSKALGVVYTANGTPIASGAGYRGIHPDGGSAPAAGDEWAFATGPVQARRTEIFTNPDQVAQALDRSLNDFEFFAERSLLVDWDKVLQAGVLIDRSTFA